MTVVRPIVLVVEDDHDIRESLGELLRDHDFEFVGAANGRRALEALSSMLVLPRVILLDLMMPVMDGAAFRREQLENSALRDIPIVLMSANSGLAALRTRLGIEHALAKPLDIERMLEVLRSFS